jgi:hypothetical protein
MVSGLGCGDYVLRADALQFTVHTLWVSHLKIWVRGSESRVRFSAEG